MDDVIASAETIAWTEHERYPGAQLKILRVGEQGEPLAFLLRLPPGHQIPVHAHGAVEHRYVLEGQYESQGKHLGAGTYFRTRKAEKHGPSYTAQGATMLVILE